MVVEVAGGAVLVAGLCFGPRPMAAPDFMATREAARGGRGVVLAVGWCEVDWQR